MDRYERQKRMEQMPHKDQTIAALRAQPAEATRDFDLFKKTNDDLREKVTEEFTKRRAVRAQLKQAEEERDELRTKGAYWETLVRSWPESLEARLAAKDAELADLRNWKESAMTVFSKIDLQEIGKEIGVRLGHDISPAILPWIVKVKAELAEKDAEIASLNTKLIDASNAPGVNDINFKVLWKIKGDLETKLAEKEREIDDAVELLEALGQQKMDDYKKHKTEVALYRKAVEPVKECLVNCKAAMEYALQYLDGIGLSAANDLKEAIEEITRTQDCIRILGEAGNERD